MPRRRWRGRESRANHAWRGEVPTSATRTPRPASAAAKFAATESCSSPSAEVTTIERGSRSVATLVAARARNAASLAVPGLAISLLRDRLVDGDRREHRRGERGGGGLRVADRVVHAVDQHRHEEGQQDTEAEDEERRRLRRAPLPAVMFSGADTCTMEPFELGLFEIRLLSTTSVRAASMPLVDLRLLVHEQCGVDRRARRNSELRGTPVAARHARARACSAEDRSRRARSMISSSRRIDTWSPR